MSLSSQEKKALASMSAIVIFVGASIWEIGKRNFWFEAKNTYQTRVQDADGLRAGSVVTIAGLRVGEVKSLDVDDKNQIAVTLTVRRTVASRLRADSVATVIRAFIIGEKRIDLIPGTAGQPELANGATIPGKDTTELTDFLSGKKLAELMTQIETLIGGLNTIVKEMDDVATKYESGSFNKMLAMAEPAMTNFIHLSDDLAVLTKELRKKSKDLPVIVESGATLFKSINGDFFGDDRLAKSTVAKVDRVMTPLAQRQKLLGELVDSVGELAAEIHENPGYTKKVMDAVDDLSVTLRALQKTWFLEDQTAEVKKQKKKEMAAERKKKQKKQQKAGFKAQPAPRSDEAPAAQPAAAPPPGDDSL
jgi:phospholipid/cholesterol/gamma-HCH transport system substrate-binding protein